MITKGHAAGAGRTTAPTKPPSLHVFNNQGDGMEPPDVIILDVDAVFHDYSNRDSRMSELNVLEFVGGVLIAAKDPTELPLPPSRLVFPTQLFADLAWRLRDSPAEEAASLARHSRVLKDLPPGGCFYRHLLRRQLSRCAACGGGGGEKKGATPTNLFHCTGCDSFAYCSAICQKNDWAHHRIICAKKKKTSAVE
jgi:hypothetical protein